MRRRDTRGLTPLAALLALIAAAVAPSSASAAPETLSPGIVYDAASGYHVVTIDLDSDATEVRVAATHPNRSNDVVTVQTHALQEGATVAINANYFGGYPSNYTCGLARGFNAVFPDGYPEAVNCVTSLGWARGVGAIFDSAGHEHDAAFMTTYTDVVTGGGYLLSGGQPHDWNHAKLEAGRDCTAVGLSADRKHFVMVVTNSTVCSGNGLQQALLAHGAADAVHLDGGGSSKMWIRGKGYVNDEVEDRMPPVAVIARPNGACPSDCGAAQCVQLDRPFRAQCVGQACRAGMNAIWNCDVGKLRRVSCQNGVVAKEYCAQGCQVMPVGSDDVCVGGAIPEPAPPSDAGADAVAPGNPGAPGGPGAPSADGGSAAPAGDAPNGDSSSGCAVKRRPSPERAAPWLALLALGATLVGARRLRNRG